MPTFPTLDAQQRNEVANIALSALGGFINLKLDGAPVRRKGVKTESGTRLICSGPDHETPERPAQCYICSLGHKFSVGDLGKARELEDGTLVPIVNDEARVEAVTGGLERGILELTAHPADEVYQWTRPEGTALRLRLQKKHSESDKVIYAALVNLCETAGFALTGPMVTDKTRRLWVLSSWHRQLYLEARIETADLAPPDDIPTPADVDKVDALTAGYADALEVFAVPFDPDMYRHDKKAAIDELAAAILADPDAAVVPTGSPVVATSVDQLLGALEDMVGRKRAEKAKTVKKPAKAKASA